MEFSRCASRWVNGYQSDDTKSTEWGTLIDGLVLSTTEDFLGRCAITPAIYPCKPTKNDPRTEKPWNWNADLCDDWRKEQEAKGKLIFKHALYTEAMKAAETLTMDPEAKEFIECSFKQTLVTADYCEEDTGIVVPVKCLIDLVPSRESRFNKSLGDLKTCRNACPYFWQREVEKRGYHVQAAIYLDVYCAATGEDRCDFRHILQENMPPYQIGKRFLSQEYIELGRQTYLAALQRYCRSISQDYWPGYEEPWRGMVIDGWQLTEPEPYMLLKEVEKRVTRERPEPHPEEEGELVP